MLCPVSIKESQMDYALATTAGQSIGLINPLCSRLSASHRAGYGQVVMSAGGRLAFRTLAGSMFSRVPVGKRTLPFQD